MEKKHEEQHTLTYGSIRLDTLGNSCRVGLRMLVVYTKNKKKRLLALIDECILELNRLLDLAECIAKREAEDNLAKLLREDETKWAR